MIIKIIKYDGLNIVIKEYKRKPHLLIDIMYFQIFSVESKVEEYYEIR